MDINFLQKRIKDLCDQHHISIDKMLKECNLKPSVVDNIKKGSIPAVDKVLIIAEYFNVSIYYLLGLDDVPNRKGKSSKSDITERQQRLLELFDLLTDYEQGELMGELKSKTKERVEAKNAETA